MAEVLDYSRLDVLADVDADVEPCYGEEDAAWKLVEGRVAAHKVFPDEGRSVRLMDLPERGLVRRGRRSRPGPLVGLKDIGAVATFPEDKLVAIVFDERTGALAALPIADNRLCLGQPGLHLPRFYRLVRFVGNHDLIAIVSAAVSQAPPVARAYIDIGRNVLLVKPARVRQPTPRRSRYQSWDEVPLE